MDKEVYKERSMFMCVVLVMALTSASSSVTSCLPVMSLVRMMSLPGILVPLPAAAAMEVTTQHTQQRGALSPSYSSIFSFPSISFSHSSPPWLSTSSRPSIPPQFLSTSRQPSLPLARRVSSSPSAGVREEERFPIHAELIPKTTSLPWPSDDTFGERLNESFSHYYSSISPCVPEDVPKNSSEANFTCNPHRINRSSQVGALRGREWMRIIGFSLIFVVGVVGNVLVVVTLLHHRNLRSLTNVFLLNLAVSDLLLGVFCMPFTLVGSLLQDFVFGALMCRLIPYMQAVSVSVSVWTLVAISLERFYAICQPLRSRRWQTASHAYRVIAGVWAASLLLMTPIAALSTLMPVRGDPGRHKCREVWASLEVERIFTILLTVLLLLVPLVVMAAAYLRVVRTLWLGPHLPGATSKGEESLRGGAASEEEDGGTPSRLSRVSIRFRRRSSRGGRQACSGNAHQQAEENNMDSGANIQQAAATTTAHVPAPRLGHVCCESGVSPAGRCEGSARWRPLRSSQAQRSLVAKRRVIRMLFVLVAEFFICWTPLFLVNLLSLYIPRQVYAALGSFGVSLVQLLAYLSSCSNPLTYCFMNAKFIQSFKLAFACTRRRPPASLRGVAVISSFHNMGVSYHHDPSLRRPAPGLASSYRNGTTHGTVLEGTVV